MAWGLRFLSTHILHNVQGVKELDICKTWFRGEKLYPHGTYFLKKTVEMIINSKKRSDTCLQKEKLALVGR